MPHLKTLFTGQWADLPFEEVCKIASSIGYEGLEIACWGDHFEVDKTNEEYCQKKLAILAKYNLKVMAISAHLVGQAVCDRIDERHKSILPDYVWGDGNPDGVRQRAANEIIKTAHAAKLLGVNIINGFTGSSIWHLLYSFPPVPKNMIDEGYADFARRWLPILNEYQKLGVRFCIEVHPTEIAFDIVTAEQALKAIDYHPAFGFNFDPSHFGYQGVDYIEFIHRFAPYINHVHMKDVRWSNQPKPIGIFGGHTDFGDYRRYWDFCSLGRGNINFEEVIRALNSIGYKGPLSVEWEDSGMDRKFGAKETLEFVRSIDYRTSSTAFDAAFSK